MAYTFSNRQAHSRCFGSSLLSSIPQKEVCCSLFHVSKITSGSALKWDVHRSLKVSVDVFFLEPSIDGGARFIISAPISLKSSSVTVPAASAVVVIVIILCCFCFGVDVVMIVVVSASTVFFVVFLFLSFLRRFLVL